MKVILKTDQKGLGKKGDLIEVAGGHARNFLIPAGKAVRATKGSEREAELVRLTRELTATKDLETAREIRDRLSQVELKISARASEEGKLFGSVSELDIISAINEQHNVALNEKDIILKKPIRELGPHTVEARPHTDISFELTLNIFALEG